MAKGTETRRISISRFFAGEVKKMQDTLVREVPVTVRLNESDYAVLMSTPAKLDLLAVGFLLGEGAIGKRSKVDNITVNRRDWVVDVYASGECNTVRKRGLVTSGCAAVALFKGAFSTAGLRPVRSRVKVRADLFKELADELNRLSETFRETGGIHAAALADGEGIITFAEDVGRHNAVDKVIGKAFLEEFDFGDKILIGSGRVSSEILVKCARRGIPVVASRTAPTDLAVRLAKKLGITLVGFVRGARMNVYSKENRIEQ